MSIFPTSTNLFAFYLGGSHPKSNIELHNLQFAVGQEYTDCFEQLKKDWFGDFDGVHIDGYILLDYVDGYKISVLDTIQNVGNPEFKLFCVHLGAKIEKVLEEHHITRFAVAKTANEALLKIRKSITDQSLEDIHRDKLFDVENITDLSLKYTLDIKKTQTDQTYKVINLYKKI